MPPVGGICRRSAKVEDAPVYRRHGHEGPHRRKNKTGYSVTDMTETNRRSLLERIIGMPLPWLVWAWVVLAGIWIVLAVSEPSGLHTFMAIAWTILAAVQLGTAYYTRHQERNRTRNADRSPDPR